MLENIDQESIVKLQNKPLTSSEKKSYDNTYSSLVAKTISERHYNISSCILCGSDTCDRLYIENRNIIEISCNGLLPCNFCEIPANMNLELFPEDFIIVRNEDALEIAQVKLVGELVKLKRHYLGLYGEELPLVIKKASVEDLDHIRKNLQGEQSAVPIFRRAVEKFNLNMKLVTVHYQFDRKKLFFFYTADGRVDFRELAKSLAAEFKTRIELRQIGVRDEAKRIGGLGSCGREYCCISFLSSFKRITSQLASEQNLISNIGKLGGPCGKLKCCLSFET